MPDALDSVTGIVKPGKSIDELMVQLRGSPKAA